MQIFNLYLPTIISKSSNSPSVRPFLPLKINSFDDESQSWTDGGDIFVHDFFHYGRFPSIIQATATNEHAYSKFQDSSSRQKTYSNSILISLSFSRAFRKIDSILVVW